MAKVKWLGEDKPNEPGPSFNTWKGIQFDKGKWVDVDDEQMLTRARTNQYYEVKDDKAEAKAEEAPKEHHAAHGKKK